jgi:hypothetical protein
MAVSQQRLLKVLLERVEELDEETRVPAYRKQLRETLAQIVLLEREHRESATLIQKKITEKTQILGQFLQSRGWKPE